MIPPFNHSGVLPPYLGDSPQQHASSSPYTATAFDVVERFATSPVRRRILRGWLEMRAELSALGFVDGFQWLDGSFVEDVEADQRRDPNDVDLVTFASTPAGMSIQQVQELLDGRPELFTSSGARSRFHCDAYMVRLDGVPRKVVTRAAYYLGLFSHRRRDNLWKGLLQVPLMGDEQATALLHTRDAGDTDAAAT